MNSQSGQMSFAKHVIRARYAGFVPPSGGGQGLPKNAPEISNVRTAFEKALSMVVALQNGGKWKPIMYAYYHYY